MLDGNIGYLRIPEMDDRLRDSLVSDIKSFGNTKGLIIDVRDNGGGTYGVMRAIYGFFVPDDAKPKVTNIAAYRLSPTFPRNHIEYRPTFRADWDGWNEHEREAIRQAAANFKPEWILPEGKFSEWHYMILSRERSGRGGASQRTVGGTSDDYFFYDKPLVVLSNAGSFSAADGFVNAFGDLPQVTVVGEPSAGGSGATRTFQLPKTRVVVSLASMASFRPNGKLFDGNGIEVNIPAKPTLDDFTAGNDSVLARAIEVIKEKAP
jgi:C-terminal processing protease CtpA/Prc